jgi:hypothetical protein
VDGPRKLAALAEHAVCHAGRSSLANSIWPHSHATVFNMRTVWVIFVLALIAIAGEIYSDAVLTTGLIAPRALDPATVAVGHAAKSG